MQLSLSLRPNPLEAKITSIHRQNAHSPNTTNALVPTTTSSTVHRRTGGVQWPPPISAAPPCHAITSECMAGCRPVCVLPGGCGCVMVVPLAGSCNAPCEMTQQIHTERTDRFHRLGACVVRVCGPLQHVNCLQRTAPASDSVPHTLPVRPLASSACESLIPYLRQDCTK